MDWKIREHLLEVMSKAQALRKAAESFDDEVNQQSSFDLQDARACFDEVKAIVADLDQMLVEEIEGELVDDEDE